MHAHIAFHDLIKSELNHGHVHYVVKHVSLNWRSFDFKPELRNFPILLMHFYVAVVVIFLMFIWKCPHLILFVSFFYSQSRQNRMRHARILFGIKWHRFVTRFAIDLIESNQDRLRAAIILNEKLDYNEQMIYHLLLTVSVSIEFFFIFEWQFPWVPFTNASL